MEDAMIEFQLEEVEEDQANLQVEVAGVVDHAQAVLEVEQADVAHVVHKVQLNEVEEDRANLQVEVAGIVDQAQVLLRVEHADVVHLQLDEVEEDQVQVIHLEDTS